MEKVAMSGTVKPGAFSFSALARTNIVVIAAGDLPQTPVFHCQCKGRRPKVEKGHSHKVKYIISFCLV